MRVFELECNEGEFEFIGGKWLMINSHRQISADKFAKRAYTILSSDRDQQRCTIAVKRIENGPCSGYLHDEVAVGTALEFSGPYGKLFHIYEDDARAPMLVAASDTGITAALGVLNSTRAAPFLDNCSLFWFLTDESYFLPPDYVRSHLPEAMRDRLQIVPVVGAEDLNRMDQARAAVKAELLARDARGPAERIGLAFLSGDGYINHALRIELRVQGVDLSKIRVDHFFRSTEKKAPPRNTDNLRTGFTTGACSAAAARAATRLLLNENEDCPRIEITLPNGDEANFAVKRRERDGEAAICSVVKDAGDDPDCTHLAELVAKVRLKRTPGVELLGGEGVATVTQTGLGLEVGTPSITPIPRKNITEMVEAELSESAWAGAEVEIRVPGGEEMALETTNARLGLIGGISILGTHGIVKPYSTAAFRTSVIQAINMAAHRGYNEVVLTTGGKTEQYGMEHLAHLDKDAFIQAGDFMGISVKHARKRKITRATVFGMVGKLSKMAAGVIQTHQAGSRVDMEFLSRLAGEAGAPESVQAEIKTANTARHVLEICQASGHLAITNVICEHVVRVMADFAANRHREMATGSSGPDSRSSAIGSHEGFEVNCYLVDFEGNVLGQYPPQIAPLS